MNLWNILFSIEGYTVWSRPSDDRTIFTITQGEEKPTSTAGYYKLSALLQLKGL